jgi:hypothetical protein
MAAEEAFQVSNFKFIIDQILDKRNRKGKSEYFISWKGFGPEDNTWEPKASLLLDVPDLIEVRFKKYIYSCVEF